SPCNYVDQSRQSSKTAMNKTWVNSSSTARARSRRERGAQGASVQRPPEREDRLVDPPQGYSASGGDERWRQQSQRRQMYEQYGARSSVSEEEFGDPASISPASGQERQLQSQGAYYVQPPKPSQAQKLKSGGSSSAADETREKRAREQERELQLNAKYAGIIQKRKRDDQMREKRTREEKELEQKKKKQRGKAERLEESKGRDEERQREEMRRARLARFD
ncbi:hypothetical protein GBAR_LOCUS11720, partial [Geodia barretti]